MIINKLKVKGFKIIGDELEIEFPEEGIIGIIGRNEVGKSSLLNAIEYALYGLKRGKVAGETREDIISWGKKECRLELEFTVQGIRYKIVRIFNRSNKNEVKIYQLNESNEKRIIDKLRDAEKFIEETIGMDRESFSKILYIKQNELDALRNLSKSNREALINKMVGIEIYDKVLKKMKDDRKALSDKLGELKSKEKDLKKIYEQYLEKKEMLSEAKKQRPILSDEVKELKNKLSEIRNKIRIYELKQNLDSVLELLRVKKSELRDYQEKSENLENYRELYDKYKDKIDILTDLARIYEEFDKELNELEQNIKYKRSQLENLKIEEELPTEEDLSRTTKKRKYYVISLIFYIIAYSIVISINFSLVSASLLALPLPLLAYKLIQYDKLVSKYSKGIILVEDLTKLETRKKDLLMKKKKELIEKYKYSSTTEIENQINKLNKEIKEKTGFENIEKLEWEISRLNKELKSIDLSETRAEIRDFEEQIKGLEAEIKKIEEEMGLSIVISKKEYQKLKREEKRLSDKYEERNKKLIQLEENIKNWSAGLKQLEDGYLKYPELVKDISKIKRELEIKDTLINVIKDVSASLRESVIPRAEIAINRILPDITDGRYSDLSISEDLKFKVYSVEAGGYKEKEVFSGGTQDQFLIALRLAFTESLLDLKVGSDKYCLIMDECIASSDEIRRRNIFNVIKMMKKTFSQIFIVAHIDISSFVDHILRLERASTGYTRISKKSW